MQKRLFLVLVLLFTATALVGAQDITPRPDDEIDENANITWPPPVYVLRGEVEIRGTADLPDMSSFFIEFRPLELAEDTEETTGEGEEDDDEESPWFPATLPNSEPVTDDVLGTWNTETAPDDLYEMRLVINVRGETPTYFYVSPLRVENEPPEFVVDALDDFTGDDDDPLPTATRPSVSTPVSTPTQLDTTPRVTANLNSNVRSGPGLQYDVIDTLFEGDSARVVGLSATGNNWYYIELQDGSRGWIAPSVVSSSGQISSVPRINPPATPTPVATNTPIPTGNLSGSNPDLTPNPPVCNQQFEILVNLTNNGNAQTSSPVTVLIQDVHVATGQVQTSFTRVLPQLGPGQNFVVGGSMTVSTFFNEEHRIEVIIDTDNQVAETLETDNVLSTTYVLQPGGCG